MRNFIRKILRLLGIRQRPARRVARGVFTRDRESVPQFTSQDIAEYWIGSGVDYRRLWGAYEAGYGGYVDKFKSRKVHLFIIEFRFPPNSLPLVDHEAVLKTLKGVFHDLKRINLSEDEYLRALPLFLYSVERGSGIYKFLGELRQLLMFGTVLGDEKIMDAHLENKQKRIDFLLRNFPSVDHEAAERFVMARTNYELDEVLEKLMVKGIKSIRISADPVPPTIEEPKMKLIELQKTDIEE